MGSAGQRGSVHQLADLRTELTVKPFRRGALQLSWYLADIRIFQNCSNCVSRGWFNGIQEWRGHGTQKHSSLMWHPESDESDAGDRPGVGRSQLSLHAVLLRRGP